MSNINRISYKMNNGIRNFVSGLGRSDALLPVVLLEATVIAGRTYHAQKRGGFVEARERGTEEVLGAIFWLGGVQAFNKIGDAVGKRILKLKDVDFEVGKDAVRNPLKNYMLEKAPKYGKEALAAFKFTKIASSILMANAVIGFIVPKMNQAITNNYQKSAKKIELENSNLQKNNENLDSFIKKTSGKTAKETSFQGNAVQTLLTLTNNFENDARYKLLSTDVGIAGGRAVNARNKNERREILFRDLSSVYFYMFCRSHLDSLLNLVQSGRTTRLDPVSAKKLDSHLKANLDAGKAYSAEEFEKAVLGNKKAEIPANIQAKIKNGIIELEEFKKLEKNPSTVKCGELMSNLQPALKGSKILTTEQMKDIYSGGLINEPKFLGKIFKKFTNNKSINPMKFVPEKDLRNHKQKMVDYVEDIINKAKAEGESITMDTLKKANKKNFTRNAFNLGAGFAVSAYFLSIAIPKIQYWITKKQTGEDKFPVQL